jgi:hypothetical protein
MTVDQSACVFRRLSLYLLRPTEIEEMLCKTQVQLRSTEMLRQRWGVSTDKDVAGAARLLFGDLQGPLG